MLCSILQVIAALRALLQALKCTLRKSYGDDLGLEEVSGCAPAGGLLAHGGAL